MDTSMPTIRLLFNSHIVYIIPNYQRTYVWNEEDQWEPLWLDVLGVAHALDREPKPHFLGATVLKEKSGAVEDAKQYSVVDGQQRLTTIQLLLAAVADVFRRYEDLSALRKAACSLTINWVGGDISDSEPDKLQPLGRDFQSFAKVMSASRNGDQIEDVADSIGDCYRFFLDKVSSWLENSEDPCQLSSRANALLTAISDHMQVVAIYLNHTENEYAIFEALNARGEPLSEWEKTKNYILFKAGELPGVNQGELYEKYLKGFDDREWMEETGTGAARRRMSDQFLDYWLESKLHKQVAARRVFREFRTEMTKSNIDLQIWCDGLRRDGVHFLEWETTSAWNGDVTEIFHSRRRGLRIGAIWPLLLALSRVDMSAEDRDRCFRVLDSFLWRRAISGMSTRNYDAVALDLLNALPKEPTGEMPYSDAIITHLIARDDGSEFWPSDHVVRNAIFDTPFYQRWIQRNVRILLEAIERAIMRGKHPGNDTMPSWRPIEHIMPQKREDKDWPSPSDGDGNEEERNEAIHRLGNLTLVEHGLNSMLSNKSWSCKREILQKEDNLYINKDLLVNAPKDHWDEEQIQLRGQRLADYIVTIWPHGHDVTAEIELIET